MSCVGTAGHVDHGKSTLVQALTGIDPDRLVEEKVRGMTIDLGFAWLTLPSGREISIVDVPGHERFIKNMLAGVGGLDAALLVIAADEGIMPQTREHLAILDLLRVSDGLVALTKADLVDDEWLVFVSDEVRTLLQSTTLSQAPIIPCSARTGLGLPALLTELDQVLTRVEQKQEKFIPKNSVGTRLPIDRIFSLTGFGTIVTGTLLDGPLTVGQEIEILPQGLKARIRTIQTHQQRIDVAQPGSRVAVNLPNVPRSDLARGNVLALPAQLRPTLLCDVKITLVDTAEHPLAHNTQVEFFSGAQEIPARVRLLNTNELAPGQSAWAQLRLSRPAVVARRDRFILRIPSPSMTIGGGEVLDVAPRYHRRFQLPVLQHLEQLDRGTPAELLLVALTSGQDQPASGLHGYTLSELVRLCNLSIDVTQAVLKTLLTEEKVCLIGEYWFATNLWQKIAAEAVELVRLYHQQYPLRKGLSREEWRTRLRISARLAQDLLSVLQYEQRIQLVDPGIVDGLEGRSAGRSGALICLPSFRPSFTPEQEQQVARLLRLFLARPYTPPLRSEAEAIVGEEVLHALVDQGRLVKCADEVLFARETYNDAVERLQDFLRLHHTMTVAEARDQLQTSRRYILALLEHLDALHITQRRGDEQVLVSP